MNVNQILTSERGSVVAPAGCGKTQLIIAALNNPHGKPILVLTHTTAGVAALKKRLRKFKVANQNFVVTTIDGWALRVAHHFAASCPMHSSQKTQSYFIPRCGGWLTHSLLLVLSLKFLKHRIHDFMLMSIKTVIWISIG